MRLAARCRWHTSRHTVLAASDGQTCFLGLQRDWGSPKPKGKASQPWKHKVAGQIQLSHGGGKKALQEPSPWSAMIVCSGFLHCQLYHSQIQSWSQNNQHASPSFEFLKRMHFGNYYFYFFLKTWNTEIKAMYIHMSTHNIYWIFLFLVCAGSQYWNKIKGYWYSINKVYFFYNPS